MPFPTFLPIQCNGKEFANEDTELRKGFILMVPSTEYVQAVGLGAKEDKAREVTKRLHDICTAY